LVFSTCSAPEPSPAPEPSRKRYPETKHRTRETTHRNEFTVDLPSTAGGTTSVTDSRVRRSGPSHAPSRSRNEPTPPNTIHSRRESCRTRAAAKPRGHPVPRRRQPRRCAPAVERIACRVGVPTCPVREPRAPEFLFSLAAGLPGMKGARGARRLSHSAPRTSSSVQS